MVKGGSIKWSLHEQQPLDCHLKPVKMVVKWVSGSDEPAVECQSCMRYFFSVW